jgi:hypothetical protein
MSVILTTDDFCIGPRNTLDDSVTSFPTDGFAEAAFPPGRFATLVLVSAASTIVPKKKQLRRAAIANALILSAARPVLVAWVEYLLVMTAPDFFFNPVGASL